jgi:hypothetical protein
MENKYDIFQGFTSLSLYFAKTSSTYVVICLLELSLLDIESQHIRRGASRIRQKEEILKVCNPQKIPPLITYIPT